MNSSIRLLGCVVLLPAVAWAFQPLVTDDTGTQGAGGNQFEAAYDRAVSKAPGTREVTQGVPLVFTRGVADPLDLYAGGTYLRIEPAAPALVERGWSNVILGTKWRFYENDASKLSFAVRPEIQFPVSKNREARGLGTARASYGVAFIMTQETGFGAVHANAVAERMNFSDDALNAAVRRNLYRLSVAPVWDVAEGWQLALDAGVVTNPDRAAKDRLGYIEIGAIYSPSKDLDLALGILREIDDGDASTTAATVGVTWRFQ